MSETVTVADSVEVQAAERIVAEYKPDGLYEFDVYLDRNGVEEIKTVRAAAVVISDKHVVFVDALTDGLRSSLFRIGDVLQVIREDA